MPNKEGTMSNGVVIYRGASEIDGSPIMAIATGMQSKSVNPKLGPRMVQTWIIRADISPIEAVVTGEDFSICGNCTLRGAVNGRKVVNRTCYVPVYFAPLTIWKCYQSIAAVPQTSLPTMFSGRGI